MNDHGTNIPESALMEIEWHAWQRWCHAAEGLIGISINDERAVKLVALTRIWGEQLARVRRAQPLDYGMKVIGDEGARLSEEVE